MARVQLDARGLKCPTPTLMLTNSIIKKEVVPGDTLAIIADCPTFEADVRNWCNTMKKVLVLYKEEQGVKKAEIRV